MFRSNKKEHLVFCLFSFFLIKYHLVKWVVFFIYSQKDIYLALVPILELSQLWTSCPFHGTVPKFKGIHCRKQQSAALSHIICVTATRNGSSTAVLMANLMWKQLRNKDTQRLGNKTTETIAMCRRSKSQFLSGVPQEFHVLEQQQISWVVLGLLRFHPHKLSRLSIAGDRGSIPCSTEWYQQTEWRCCALITSDPGFDLVIPIVCCSHLFYILDRSLSQRSPCCLTVLCWRQQGPDA